MNDPDRLVELQANPYHHQSFSKGFLCKHLRSFMLQTLLSTIACHMKQTTSHPLFEICPRKTIFMLFAQFNLSRQRSDWWKSTIANPCVQPSFPEKNAGSFSEQRLEIEPIATLEPLIYLQCTLNCKSLK